MSTPPLRLLYVTDFLPHARSDHGGGKMLHGYIESMRGLGHRVSLLALCQPKDRDAIAAAREAFDPVEIVSVENSRSRRARSFAAGLFEMEARAYCRSAGIDARAAAFLAGHDFDVAHVVHPWLMDVVAGALPPQKRKAIRLVGHVIDIQTEVVRRRMGKSPSARLLKEYVWASLTEARHYARMDRLMTHARSDAAWIATRLRGRPPASVIPVWFDAERDILPAVPPRAQSNRFIVVGASSDPRMREGVSWLLQRVWPTVIARHPEATLHLHSVRAEDRGPWLEGPGVIPHAYIDDLLAVYDEACALVFPLRSGGFSRHLKILNAMARGCPIVMTSEANTAEQLRDSVEALICDSPAAFASAMISLLDTPEAGKRLAVAGLQRVNDAYGGYVASQALMSLYVG